MINPIGLNNDNLAEFKGFVPKNTENIISIFNSNRDKMSDGVIGDFKQGRTGDCYLLASLKSLSMTDEGKRILKSNIRKKTKDSYEVTLPGAILVKNDYKTENKKCYITGKYTITKFDIDKARKSRKYSSGDLDVLIYELAFEKYRKEVLKTNDVNNQSSQYGQAGQYTGSGSFADPLKGGKGNDATFILTGKKSKVYSVSSDNVASISSESIKSINSIDSKLSKRGVNNILDKFKSNPERYSITFSLKLDGGTGKHGFHAVSLSRVDDDRVYFVNPWDSKKEFSVARSDLFKLTHNIEIADMQAGSLMENVTDGLINLAGMFF